MARLDKKPYPGNWDKLDKEDWMDYNTRTISLFNDIPQDRIISFPIADGYAQYFVKSFKPLVLQHIPYGDGYGIPDAHIRGLRKDDVNARLNHAAMLRELFKK